MSIKLAIKLGDRPEDAVVSVSGYEVEPIDDEMAREFGIPRTVVAKGSDDRIWGYLAHQLTGRPPNEFMLSDPVIGSDWVTDRREWFPFRDRGLQGVRIERRPVAARLFSATGEPKTIAGPDLVKNPPEARTNLTGTVTLSESVTEESSRTREKNWSIGMEQSIGVEVEGGLEGVAKGKISRSMTLSFSRGGSDSRTQSTSRTLSHSRSANYDVPPGRVHEYSLAVGSGGIEVDIDYQYRIIGMCSAVYKKPHNGSSFYDFDVVKMLVHLGAPTFLETTERLSIGLVSDATIQRFPRDFIETDR